MNIGKLNLFSNFHFQIENEKWKSPSDFRFPFSNQKRKSELWNSTRTLYYTRFPVEIDNEKRVMKTSYKSTKYNVRKLRVSDICFFVSNSKCGIHTLYHRPTQRLSELSLGKNITLQKLRRAPTSACIFLTRDVRMSLA